MKTYCNYILCAGIVLILLNACLSLRKGSNQIHFCTDGLQIYSSEYCGKLPEDYEIYKKLYNSHNDVVYMFKYLDLLDSACAYCENYTEDLLFTKYDLLMTIGLYQECIDYMLSIPDSMFTYPYTKIFFVNTAQSALNQISGDTISRNENNKKIVTAIINYWSKEIDMDKTQNAYIVAQFFHNTNFLRHSSTMVMFYVARARYEHIDFLQDEISSLPQKDDMDSLFLKNLSQGLKDMNNRKYYHFERDIIINPHTIGK